MWATAACATLGAVGAVALTPVTLGALGFTAGGIAAGSFASWLMATAAVANGGGVATGGFVALLQSVGAAGLSGSATALVASIGGAIGGWIGSFL